MAGASKLSDMMVADPITDRLIGDLKNLIYQRFDDFDKRYQERFDSSEKAIDKAELANSKRFDTVNEFRAALADKDKLQATRLDLEKAVDALEKTILTVAGRIDGPAGLALRLESMVTKADLDIREGRALEAARENRRGMIATTAAIAAIITVVISVLNNFARTPSVQPTVQMVPAPTAPMQAPVTVPR